MLSWWNVLDFYTQGFSSNCFKHVLMGESFPSVDGIPSKLPFFVTFYILFSPVKLDLVYIQYESTIVML